MACLLQSVTVSQFSLLFMTLMLLKSKGQYVFSSIFLFDFDLFVFNFLKFIMGIRDISPLSGICATSFLSVCQFSFDFSFGVFVMTLFLMYQIYQFFSLLSLNFEC